MPLLLERVSPSSRIFMDVLEFHPKSRSRLGLLSSPYLISQRFSLSELQINYLRCLYYIQEKQVLIFKKNGSTNDTQPASTTIIIILMIFGNHGALRSSFMIDLELVVLDLPQIQAPQMTLS